MSPLPSELESLPLPEESGLVLSSVDGLVSAGALIVVVVTSPLFPPAVPVPVPLSGLSLLHAVRDRSIIAVVVIIKAFFIFGSPYIRNFSLSFFTLRLFVFFLLLFRFILKNFVFCVGKICHCDFVGWEVWRILEGQG